MTKKTEAKLPKTTKAKTPKPKTPKPKTPAAKTPKTPTPKRPAPKAVPAGEMPVVSFAQPSAWSAWLASNHRSSPGVWLKLAKKASGVASITYPEALDAALAWGWIDGLKRAHDDTAWLQKFTPRGRKSLWSKINRDKALALIEAGKMQPAGLEEVLRAKLDGRWEAAYDSPSRATVPADFEAALAANPRAAAFFATLNSGNRYAVLFRIQTVKKAETRAKKIALFVDMLARHEKIHP